MRGNRISYVLILQNISLIRRWPALWWEESGHIPQRSGDYWKRVEMIFWFSYRWRGLSPYTSWSHRRFAIFSTMACIARLPILNTPLLLASMSLGRPQMPILLTTQAPRRVLRKTWDAVDTASTAMSTAEFPIPAHEGCRMFWWYGAWNVTCFLPPLFFDNR